MFEQPSMLKREVQVKFNKKDSHQFYNLFIFYKAAMSIKFGMNQHIAAVNYD